MKIVVPVKQVGQLHDGFGILDGNRVDPDFVDSELNEWDIYSLAAAAELVGQTDAEVIAVTVGADCEGTLRQAIALGATRAVQIAVPEASEPDVLQVAQLLAEFVRHEEASLVLCGVQSSDAGTGATPAALAGYLKWPRIGAVLHIDSADGDLEVRRELAGGSVELLAVPSPVVLAMQSGSYELPYPAMKAKMAAKRATIEVFTVNDLLGSVAEYDDARGSEALGLAAKASSGSGVTLEGRPTDVAAAIRKIIGEALA